MIYALDFFRGAVFFGQNSKEICDLNCRNPHKNCCKRSKIRGHVTFTCLAKYRIHPGDEFTIYQEQWALNHI